jgi:hypothetical protein
MSRFVPVAGAGAPLNDRLRIWNRILRLVLDLAASFSDTGPTATGFSMSNQVVSSGERLASQVGGSAGRQVGESDNFLVRRRPTSRLADQPTSRPAD